MRMIIGIFAIATIAASCNSAADKEKEAELQAQQYTIDSMKVEMAKQHVVDSMNEVARLNTPEPKTVIVTHTTSGRNGTNGTNGTNGADGTNGTNGTNATKKKGWSAKATGAVIGAGAGAITGAAVSKEQKGKGAIIGGVIGAGTGLGVGAVIDEKNGR